MHGVAFACPLRLSDVILINEKIAEFYTVQMIFGRTIAPAVKTIQGSVGVLQTTPFSVS
jgi:hypothetical protein